MDRYIFSYKKTYIISNDNNNKKNRYIIIQIYV